MSNETIADRVDAIIEQHNKYQKSSDNVEHNYLACLLADSITYHECNIRDMLTRELPGVSEDLRQDVIDNLITYGLTSWQNTTALSRPHEFSFDSYCYDEQHIPIPIDITSDMWLDDEGYCVVDRADGYTTIADCSLIDDTIEVFLDMPAIREYLRDNHDIAA